VVIRGIIADLITMTDVVGLIPAAGRGKRIAPLPCSKELYPIGFRHDAHGELRPEVASAHLIDKFRHAGITRTFIILREGKWDIPAYFGDGRNAGVDLAYVVIEGSIGPPDTLDRAYPFVAGQHVAFGFPDILFGPDDVFTRLLEHQRQADAQIVLGCYPAHDVRQLDMLDIDAHGTIRAVHLKPQSSSLVFSWICAVWSPEFSRFMHEHVERERATHARNAQAYSGIDPQGDLPVGAVIKAAVEQGMRVHGVTFPDERFIDIGTPESLIHALKTRLGHHFDPS
jgi:glucose-1-phosphate thymidylyltransferase